MFTIKKVDKFWRIELSGPDITNFHEILLWKPFFYKLFFSRMLFIKPQTSFLPFVNIGTTSFLILSNFFHHPLSFFFDHPIHTSLCLGALFCHRTFSTGKTAQEFFEFCVILFLNSPHSRESKDRMIKGQNASEEWPMMCQMHDQWCVRCMTNDMSDAWLMIHQMCDQWCVRCMTFSVSDAWPMLCQMHDQLYVRWVAIYVPDARPMICQMWLNWLVMYQLLLDWLLMC